MSPITKLAAIFALCATMSASVVAAPLEQRSSSGTATYFEVGLGACGWNSVDSDYIVALQTEAYSDGSHCGKKIKVQANGKTTSATVVDMCPGCDGTGSIDMSPGLFKHFNSLDVGVFPVTWWFE